MIHRIAWRVAAADALDYWEQRLADEGTEARREDESLVFADPEGLEHELRVSDVSDPPLIAYSAEVPDEHALQGFDAVHIFTPSAGVSDQLLENALSFERRGDGEWEARGEERGGRAVYTESSERGLPGGGTVHHVAWSVGMDEQEDWRERVIAAGGRPTPVIDRFYFSSVYFREPSGVLFELATRGPGFDADEPLESLGERLSLPPDYEQLRDRLEPVLTPLPDTRPWRRSGVTPR